MRSEVLLELAERWESDAKEPEKIDGSEEAKVRNAVDKGCRETKRECADTLRALVNLLG